MFIKRALSIALVLCCILCGCAKEHGQETATPSGNITDMMGDYTELYSAYMAKALNVQVILTVDMGYSIENRFSLTEGGDGYTLTDLGTDEVYTYELKDEEKVCKTAGYLPPSEVAYPAEDGGYSARLSGDLALEKLLQGSNLFDGYDSDCVSLDGECLYSAYADGGISSYSYEFSVNVDDGEAQFSAKIKYLIEVI